MINMKIEEMDEEDKMEAASPESDPSDAPKYPYGLRICLDDDSLMKLKIQELPKVGSSMMMLAKVEVCSARSYATMVGGTDNSIELQITDMELRPEGKKSAQSALYGGE